MRRPERRSPNSNLRNLCCEEGASMATTKRRRSAIFRCVVAQDDALDLDRRTLPGGAQARTRVRGRAPELYYRIGDAFDVSRCP